MSLTQEQVVEHMKDGWELGYSNFTNRYWLQKPGLCKGGDSKKVILVSVRAMLRSGKIRKAAPRDGDHLSLTRFELRKEGE